MSSTLSNAERTSWLSFARISGWVSSRYVAPANVVAVVSDPARTRMNAFEDSFSNDRFYDGFRPKLVHIQRLGISPATEKGRGGIPTYPFLTSLNEAFEEVVALLIHSQPFLDHVVGILPYSNDRVPAHLSHYLYEVAQSDICKCYHDGAEAYAPENELDPGVIVDIFETVERLPKDEVAHDIERGPVVPSLNVQLRLSLVAFLVQSLNN